MTTINPGFGKTLKKYGADSFNACYNCGNCTAVCSLSTPERSFPREMVRLSTLGLETDIKSSLKPWECYYCGECSTHCPQEADPGELMMSLRRYLTGQYDWTGLSGLMYRSLPLTLAAFILTMVGVLAFVASVGFDLSRTLHVGHLFEMVAIGTVGLVILLPNVLRMWYFTVFKPHGRIPLKKYVSSFGELLVHLFTQKQALGCDENQLRWFEHFILVIGYLSLLFTTVFLNWFDSQLLVVTVLGYVVSAIVFVVTIDFIADRMKKRKALSKHAQPSDWFFVIWLFLMGFTAFLVRLFIDLDLLETNKWLYVVHLTVLVQWALIIVPFGKWTHFLYRSFALYFVKLNAGER